MTTKSQSGSDTVPSDFERRVAEARAALEAMPEPAPTTSRQVIITTREDIKRKAAEHGHGGLEKVWQVYVSIGHNLKLSTFRDYVYNGETSREAKGAEAARKTRRSRKVTVVTEEAIADTAIVTESTAGGGPVRARKMR